MPKPKPSIDRLMAEAKAHLVALGAAYTCPTRTQLKIGPVSYFPSTGTVFVDGEDARRPGAGPGLLEAVLREFGALGADDQYTADAADLAPRVIRLSDVMRGRTR
jgi:hypothetical protein